MLHVPLSIRWDLAKWLYRLTANAEVATFLGSIPAYSDTVESKGQQMKQCWKSTEKTHKKSFFTIFDYYKLWLQTCEQNLKSYAIAWKLTLWNLLRRSLKLNQYFFMYADGFQYVCCFVK